MGRVNVSMKNELIADLEKISQENGKSISTILSESAHFYIESSRSGIAPDQIMRSFRILTLLQEIDSVPVPGQLLDFLIRMSMESSDREVLGKWHERGFIIGDIVKKYAPTLADFSRMIEEYRPMIPVNLFSIDIKGSTVRIIVSGAGYSKEASRCSAEGLSGFLESYGYQTESTEATEGFVKISARNSS